MRIIRLLGNIALWIGALLGIIAGGVWIGGQLGWVQPLIVISGSMEPGIHTGDLLIDRNIATDDVEVGDVVSLHSEMTGKLVTHRVVEVTQTGDAWEINLKGDANDNADLENYVVGDSVLTPAIQIPMGGTVVSKLMEPAVALPILLALLALLGMSLLDEEPRQTASKRRADELDDDLADDPTDDLDDRLDDAAEPPVRVVHDPIDDLDEALAALGIDVREFDRARQEPTWPDDAKQSLEVVWPDDDSADIDEDELVMSG